MANSTAGNFWLLDTAGVVVDTPVFVKDVKVTWKVSSAGALELTEFNRERGVGSSFINATSLAASSAAAHQMTQTFEINKWIAGLNVKTITEVASLIVNVG